MANAYLWINAGQSNSWGVGTGVDAPDCDPTLAFEWDPAVGIAPLSEPVSWDSDYKPQTGSAWPAFINEITQATGAISVLCRTAIGGSALLESNGAPPQPSNYGNWSPTGTRFPNAVTRALAAKAAIEAAGHTVVGINVMWHQGERDALIGNDLDQFQAAFQALVGRFRTALSWPTLKIYVARIGRPTGAYESNTEVQERCALVRGLQDAACAAQDGLEMAYLRCVDFPELNWMKFDGAHYKQVGYNDMGRHMGEYVVVDLGFTPPPPPPQDKPVSLIARRLMVAPAVPPDTIWTQPASFTWTVPYGVSSIDVECVGAGGGGGSGATLNRGSGGGGGAYAATSGISVVGGQQFTITVGTGGQYGQNNISQVATAGGASSVVGAITVSAAGGGGGGNNAGTPGAGGTTAASTGNTKSAGSTGLIGSGAIGNRGKGGDAAAPLGGAGGAGEAANGTNGNPGTNPGGGGAGGGITAGAFHGGVGASGLVKITLHYDN